MLGFLSAGSKTGMPAQHQVSKVTGAKTETGEVLPLSAEKRKLNHSLLVQAYAKLETCLDELIAPERMQQLSETFEPPPRHVLGKEAIQPLPHQAPATALTGGKAQMDGKPILDKRPQSEREKTIQKAKQIVMLMCRCGLEAQRAEEGEFAVRVCTKAISTAVDAFSFGPAPIEVEGALLLAACAYSKSQCLSWEVEDLGLLILSCKHERGGFA